MLCQTWDIFMPHDERLFQKALNSNYALPATRFPAGATVDEVPTTRIVSGRKRVSDAFRVIHRKKRRTRVTS